MDLPFVVLKPPRRAARRVIAVPGHGLTVNFHRFVRYQGLGRGARAARRAVHQAGRIAVPFPYYRGAR